MYFNSKSNKKLNLVKITEMLGYKFVPAGRPLFYYNEFGTSYFINLKGISSAWVPIDGSLILNIV